MREPCKAPPVPVNIEAMSPTNPTGSVLIVSAISSQEPYLWSKAFTKASIYCSLPIGWTSSEISSLMPVIGFWTAPNAILPTPFAVCIGCVTASYISPPFAETIAHSVHAGYLIEALAGTEKAIRKSSMPPVCWQNPVSI